MSRIEQTEDREGREKIGKVQVNETKEAGERREKRAAQGEKKRRSATAIMGSLIGLVKPMLPIMLAAILLGTAGYLCAIFLTILAGQVVLKGLLQGAMGASVFIKGGGLLLLPLKKLLLIMLLIAFLRGILHYMEQYCNHFIAFKLLAIIRHKVFHALRRLCPAKLEGKEKGNLISIITTDIELLEVFYAHTISPIAIAILTECIMVLFIGSYHVLAGCFALLAYLIVGLLIPIWNGKRGGDKGMAFRTGFGELNSFVLDSLRGLDETIQYGQGSKRKEEMSQRSVELADLQKDLSKLEGNQRSLTNLVILLASFGMLFLMLLLYGKNAVGFDGLLTCTIAMMGSFGPVVALSSLSNNLNQTLSSGERVLSLLEEEPLVEEIPDEREKEGSGFAEREKENQAHAGGEKDERIFAGSKEIGKDFAGAEARNVYFSYQKSEKNKGNAIRGTGEEKKEEREDTEVILKDYSIRLEPGKITGIHGASGSGKSTLLKLLMRFWDVDAGSILVDKREVRTIPTRQLRDLESYVTQETQLFHDSIANNIAIAKEGATREEIIEAAKKASLHEFIMSLPKGYDTEVGELGDTLSGGEKQRIGIARAFLHEAELILLDEPTSNLDSLNEGIILKALKESAEKKTVVLVSHRASTMNVADTVYEMENGRIS